MQNSSLKRRAGCTARKLCSSFSVTRFYRYKQPLSPRGDKTQEDAFAAFLPDAIEGFGKLLRVGDGGTPRRDNDVAWSYALCCCIRILSHRDNQSSVDAIIQLEALPSLSIDHPKTQAKDSIAVTVTAFCVNRRGGSIIV